MKKEHVTIIAGLLSVLCCCAVGVFAVAAWNVNQNNETYGALAEACYGNGVAAAAAYSEASGTHLAAGMRLSGKDYSSYNYVIPDKALAKGVADAELVVCLQEEQKELLERCPYSKDDDDEDISFVERYGYEVEVTIVEAQTGKTVAEKKLKGDEPRECEDYEEFPKGKNTLTLEGEKVSSAQVHDWARPYIIIP